MMTNKKPDERLDDLQVKGYEIIQKPGRFCFGMDAVLLSSYAKVKRGERALDLGTGTGILPILLEAKNPGLHYTGLEVRVTPQRERGFDHMADRIVNYPEVTAVYLISGSYDYLVSIDGKTLMEVSRFVSEKLSTLEGVVGTTTHFILKKYKDHGTILKHEKKEERIPVMP